MILFRVSQWYVSHVTYRGIKKREGAYTKVSYFFCSAYKQGKEPIIWYIRYRTLSSRIKNCSMLVNFRLTKSLIWEFSSRFAIIEVSVNWHIYYIKRYGSYHLQCCYCQLIGFQPTGDDQFSAVFLSFTNESWIVWDSIIFFILMTCHVHKRFYNPWVISRQRGLVFIRRKLFSQYFGKEKEMWEEWHTQSCIDMAYYI